MKRWAMTSPRFPTNLDGEPSPLSTSFRSSPSTTRVLATATKERCFAARGSTRATSSSGDVPGTTAREGVAEGDLSLGPGHYPGTPLPGEKGNVAIAGHRTTWGH